MSDVPARPAFEPRSLMWMALDLMRRSASAVGTLSPEGEGRAAWREFRNKLQVFELFEHADVALGLQPGRDVTLAEQLRRARELGPYLGVWATEGLGHDHAEAAWARGDVPRDILDEHRCGPLPPGSLVALHAGVGLSFSQRLLRGVGDSRHEVRRALRAFYRLCDANARPGYEGVTYEALGLTARNVCPRLVPLIDEVLGDGGGELLAYFWHGVGRALYFAPTNFVPSADATRRGLEAARREPPHETGRLNATAGLAWALTLVNIRDPEVMSNVLSREGERLARDDAFANGVGAGVLVWYDSTRDAELIEEWWRYGPGGDDPELSRLWERLVSWPCRDALEWFYPVIGRSGLLGEVFRYRPLRELAEELGGKRRPINRTGTRPGVN